MKKTGSRCSVRWAPTSTPRLWRALVAGRMYELNQIWPRQKRFFLAVGGKEVGEFQSRADATKAARKTCAKLAKTRS